MGGPISWPKSQVDFPCQEGAPAVKTQTLYTPENPHFHRSDHAYGVYAALRDDHPVYRDPAGRFYALSRYADVRSAAESFDVFSSEGTSMAAGLLPHLQILDPPVHDRLRDLVSRAFTPRRVAAIAPRAREIARELLDRLEEQRRPDLMADFCRQLPSRVIGAMIGVPPERLLYFLEWTEAMISIDPGTSQSETVQAPAVNIYAEFESLLKERQKERRDDLMSALIDAELEGRKLSRDELLGFCFLLIVAGNDTTTNLIGNGSVLLAKHPDTRKQLTEDPSRIPSAIEEMLRYETPTQALPRIATRDVELHDTTVPKGSEVLLLFGAANRDERAFETPDHFDIGRVAGRHLAFGVGRHFCLGSHLARLEATIAFEELLARFPEYELEEEPQWLTSVWARAHSAIPIRLGAVGTALPSA